MGKAIKTRKAKLVLLAPNIASLQEGGNEGDQGGSEVAGEGQGEGQAGDHGLGCPAAALVALAAEREVPLVFALSRQRMGKVRGGGCGLLLQDLGIAAAATAKGSSPPNQPACPPHLIAPAADGAAQAGQRLCCAGCQRRV